ncbi:MAG: right-handed parallel beta-helix repeat-containing protein, partial [Simkaniaceae bacterium]|nr:right-handed parallel beta-helix repeat-containing protein [Simkaniaceae bacterium]
PTLALAQANSKPGDIIYVFPGDGSTTGMNAGITLKAAQKFWGSGVSYTLQTNQGTVILPAQSSSAPKITNADIDTDGNAITLATNNVISGFNITSPLNDAIYGADLHSLEVSSCVIESATTYALEASFSGDASISLTNNQLLNNVNGIFLTLNGTSTLVCSDNTFQDQTSVSSVPLDVSADSNTFTAHINNNLFDSNTTGSVRFNLENVVNADINLLNNTITNNGTGSQASLGSSIVLISTGVIDDCSILVKDNTFSENTSNSLYLHTSGEMTNLEVTASNNTMSDNGGSGLVIATPVDTLTLTATDNTITGCDDNGISIISSGTTTTGTVTINNNTLTDIGNTSNGISLSQNFSTLNLTVSNNEINRCEGTGILSYSPTGIDSLTLDISDNIISNCENASSNAASGIDIEQYTGLAGSVTNNTLSDNTGVAVMIGSTLSNPTVCMTLTDNTNDSSYLVSNPVGGTFNLSPCDVDTVNTGTITRDGTINAVRSCPDATSCP